jgi:hypothetical protein
MAISPRPAASPWKTSGWKVVVKSVGVAPLVRRPALLVLGPRRPARGRLRDPERAVPSHSEIILRPSGGQRR